MHDIAVAAGLSAFEAIRTQAGLSRALCCRAGGVNDVQVWKGLNGVKTRADTLSRAVAGLLVCLIDRYGEGESVSGQSFQRKVEEAALKAAAAAAAAVAPGGNARRLRTALPALESILESLIPEHYREAFALMHASHAWLQHQASEGHRLALVGSALAMRAVVPCSNQEAA